MARYRRQERDQNEANIKEVSLRWKEGYKALKDANDSMQKENEMQFKAEIAEIDAMTKSQIAQGPPKD